MDLGIAGRTAIICASSRGLGRACAIALTESGCSVIINGRNEEKLAATADEIREKTGVQVTAIAGDVSSRDIQDKILAACPARAQS